MSAPYPRPTGSLSARIKGAEIILRERQANARQVADALPDHDSQRAASLRGKAHAYGEAAELLGRIDRGSLLHFRKWTRKDRRSQPVAVVLDGEAIVRAIQRRNRRKGLPPGGAA